MTKGETTTQENLLQTQFELESENERLHDAIEKIRAEVQSNRDEWIKGLDPEWHEYNRCLGIIDKYRKEQK